MSALGTYTVRLGAVLLLIMSVAGHASSVFGFECEAATYNSREFKEVRTVFSPYEKVYVKIRCGALEAGEYAMHANWLHKKRGMVRSDKHTFKMDIRGERVVFFWFNLTKRGPFSSTITNKDFHEENFGEWVVETYLNNSKIAENNFTIDDQASF